MKPKLVPNAGRVLKHSSSLRLIEISLGITVLDLVASVTPGLKDFLPIDPVWLTAIGSVGMSAAWCARFIVQSKVKGRNDGE